MRCAKVGTTPAGGSLTVWDLQQGKLKRGPKGAIVMSSPDDSLAARLKSLRSGGWHGQTLTQAVMARALGVSVPLLSSWENGKAVPPRRRLESYARLFAATRSGPDGRVRVPEPDRLDQKERPRYEALLRE